MTSFEVQCIWFPDDLTESKEKKPTHLIKICCAFEHNEFISLSKDQEIIFSRSLIPWGGLLKCFCGFIETAALCRIFIQHWSCLVCDAQCWIQNDRKTLEVGDSTNLEATIQSSVEKPRALLLHVTAGNSQDLYIIFWPCVFHGWAFSRFFLDNCNFYGLRCWAFVGARNI